MPRDADRLDRLAVAPLSAFCPSSSPSSSYSSARTLLIFEHCVTKPRLQRRGNADKKKKRWPRRPIHSIIVLFFVTQRNSISPNEREKYNRNANRSPSIDSHQPDMKKIKREDKDGLVKRLAAHSCLSPCSSFSLPAPGRRYPQPSRRSLWAAITTLVASSPVTTRLSTRISVHSVSSGPCRRLGLYRPRPSQAFFLPFSL